MLSKSSIRMAGNIVASLENAVALVPIEGTPVDQLTTETIVGATGIPTEDVAERLHQGSMAENPMQVVTHDVVSDEVNDLIAPAIGEHFAFARHVVNPAIQEITAKVAEVVGQRAPLHNLAQFNIAGIHSSPIVAELIERYADAAIASVALFGHFPDKSEAELAEMLQSGSSALDDGLLNLVAEHPTGWLNDVYLRYFRQNNEFDQTRAFDRADELLVVHMWSIALDDNPPEGTMMPLVDYNMRITALRQQTGNALNDIYRRWDRLLQSGVLVWKYPPTTQVLTSDKDGTVFVLSPTFDRFLAEGGNPEIIFGAAVSDRKTNMTDLLQNRDQYLREYNRFVDRQTAERNNRLAATARSALASEAAKLVLASEANLPPGSSIEALQKKVSESVSLIRDHEIIEQTAAQVRWLLCSTVYQHTDAGVILDSIDKMVAENPEMSPKRAATHVAAALVVKHLLSQVVTRRVSE